MIRFRFPLLAVLLYSPGFPLSQVTIGHNEIPPPERCAMDAQSWAKAVVHLHNGNTTLSQSTFSAFPLLKTPSQESTNLRVALPVCPLGKTQIEFAQIVADSIGRQLSI
jgi:hypothetical protein